MKHRGRCSSGPREGTPTEEIDLAVVEAMVAVGIDISKEEKPALTGGRAYVLAVDLLAVDLRGIEPLTSCLPSKRSTN